MIVQTYFVQISLEHTQQTPEKRPTNADCYSGTGLTNAVVLFLFPRTAYCSAEDTYHPIVRYILDSCIYYLGHPIETVSALGDRRRAPAPESTGAATILCFC